MFIINDTKITQFNIGKVCKGQHKIKVNQTHLEINAHKSFLNHSSILTLQGHINFDRPVNAIKVLQAHG